MLDFTKKYDENGKAYLETKLSGKSLLTIPQLNKGTAFTLQERIDLVSHTTIANNRCHDWYLSQNNRHLTYIIIYINLI